MWRFAIKLVPVETCIGMIFVPNMLSVWSQSACIIWLQVYLKIPKAHTLFFLRVHTLVIQSTESAVYQACLILLWFEWQHHIDWTMQSSCRKCQHLSTYLSSKMSRYMSSWWCFFRFKLLIRRWRCLSLKLSHFSSPYWVKGMRNLWCK